MKKIIVAGLLGGAITASFLGAGAANATHDEYVGKTPEQLVQISIERSIALPGLQGPALHGHTRRSSQATISRSEGHHQQCRRRSAVGHRSGHRGARPEAAEAEWAAPTVTPTRPRPVGRTAPDADGSLMEFRNTQMLLARDTARANVQGQRGRGGRGSRRDQGGAHSLEVTPQRVLS